MATLYGSNYQASRVNEPASKISVKDQHGRVRRMYDSIVLAAELAVNDVIKVGVLPAGAKVVNARLVGVQDSASGQLDMGWASNGTDAADQDGFFAGATEGDLGGGAVDSKLSAVAAGFNKEFAAETELELTCLEVTTDSTGNTVACEVYYIVD